MTASNMAGRFTDSLVMTAPSAPYILSRKWVVGSAGQARRAMGMAAGPCFRHDASPVLVLPVWAQGRVRHGAGAPLLILQREAAMAHTSPGLVPRPI